MKVFNWKQAGRWAYAVPLAASLLLQPANQLYADVVGCDQIGYGYDCLDPHNPYPGEEAYHGWTYQYVMVCKNHDQFELLGSQAIGSCDPQNFMPRSDSCSCERCEGYEIHSTD
jgi:hypothetical protein